MDGPSVYKWWHAMWAQVCNLLFPRGCAGCDAPDEVLCAACWALFAQCRERDADSGGGARIWSASIYQGAVRRAILDWKDHDDTELDGPFGRIMVSLLNKTPIPSSCLGHRVLVVPVPSSRASSAVLSWPVCCPNRNRTPWRWSRHYRNQVRTTNVPPFVVPPSLTNVHSQ